MIQPSALHLVAALIGALALVVFALAVFMPAIRSSQEPCSRASRENAFVARGTNPDL